MLNICTLVSTLLVLVVSLTLMSTTSEALPRNIGVERRDGGDFDTILGELKSKGSRMRFGKRSQDHIGMEQLEHPSLYMPGNYYTYVINNH